LRVSVATILSDKGWRVFYWLHPNRPLHANP
jgi:hypothetical protein